MKGKHRDSRSPGPHWPFAGEAFCKDLRSFLSCSILDVFGGKFVARMATFEFPISWNLVRCGSMCGECGNMLGVKPFIRFPRFRISIRLSQIQRVCVVNPSRSFRSSLDLEVERPDAGV